MGKATGTGGEVFKNVRLKTISDSEIEQLENISRGLDFGFSADPCAYVCCCLHNCKLWIFYEYYKCGAGFDELTCYKERKQG